MPAAHIRPVSIALRAALIVMLVPLAMTINEVATRGGALTWLRLLCDVAVSGALVMALLRQAEFRRWLVERDRVDAELRASEARYAAILSISADAIVTTDESQKIVSFNHGAEEIFGYTASEAIGQPLAMLLPARYRDGHPAHVQAFARGPISARRMGERREVFGLRKNGEEFPADASISKLGRPDGTMLYTAILRDVTSRVRTQEDERFLADAGSVLTRSLEYEAVAHAIADLPVPKLANACLLYVAEGDAITCIPSTLPMPDADDALRALALRHATTWDSPSPVIDVLRRRQPEHVPVIDEEWLEASEEHRGAIVHWRTLGVRSVYMVPLTAGDRTLGAIVLISTSPSADFDDDAQTLARKYARSASLALENARLYRSAQQANRARDHVLGVVSHDLRNPLSAIAMCARALEDTPPSEVGEHAELLATIRQSTAWMNRMIQDLLDVSSIERGRLAVERRHEEVSALVSSALHMFQGEATEHGIELHTEVPGGLPPVHADAARILQVLANLVRNAVKFTPRHGTITIEATAAQREVVVSVRDTGAGIAEDAQRHVFDAYWHDSRGARARGTGLGLSIARGIVEAHGGRIWLDSIVGQGSNFHFTIPVANGAEAPDVNAPRVSGRP